MDHRVAGYFSSREEEELVWTRPLVKTVLPMEGAVGGEMSDDDDEEEEDEGEKKDFSKWSELDAEEERLKMLGLELEKMSL